MYVLIYLFAQIIQSKERSCVFFYRLYGYFWFIDIPQKLVAYLIFHTFSLSWSSFILVEIAAWVQCRSPKSTLSTCNVYIVCNQLKSLVSINYLHNGHCSLTSCWSSETAIYHLKERVTRNITNISNNHKVKYYIDELSCRFLPLRTTHRLAAIKSPIPLLLEAKD